MLSKDILSSVLARCLITGGDFAEIFGRRYFKYFNKLIKWSCRKYNIRKDPRYWN